MCLSLLPAHCCGGMPWCPVAAIHISFGAVIATPFLASIFFLAAGMSQKIEFCNRDPYVTLLRHALYALYHRLHHVSAQQADSSLPPDTPLGLGLCDSSGATLESKAHPPQYKKFLDGGILIQIRQRTSMEVNVCYIKSAALALAQAAKRIETSISFAAVLCF